MPSAIEDQPMMSGVDEKRTLHVRGASGGKLRPLMGCEGEAPSLAHASGFANPTALNEERVGGGLVGNRRIDGPIGSFAVSRDSEPCQVLRNRISFENAAQ